MCLDLLRRREFSSPRGRVVFPASERSSDGRRCCNSCRGGGSGNQTGCDVAGSSPFRPDVATARRRVGGSPYRSGNLPTATRRFDDSSRYEKQDREYGKEDFPREVLNRHVAVLAGVGWIRQPSRYQIRGKIPRRAKHETGIMTTEQLAERVDDRAPCLFRSVGVVRTNHRATTSFFRADEVRELGY